MKDAVIPYQAPFSYVQNAVLKPSKDNIKIKVVLPAYNEARSIGPIINCIQSSLSKMDFPFEIIVIDDGSSDSTAEIVQNLDVTYKRNKTNRGKGYSVIKAFRLAKEDEFIIMMDSDGEHFPEDIPRLLKPALLNQSDMVIGSRFIKTNGKRGGGSYLNNGKRHSQLRKFGNWLFSTTIWVLTRKKINDTQSGFRVFRPGVVKRLEIQSLGFTIETEITTQVLIRGGRVMEVPIQNGKPFRGSYMHILIDGIRIILTACREGFPKRLRPSFNRILKYQN